jgi:hypothetical protein
MKVSDLRAQLTDVPESHRAAIQFSYNGRPLFDCQLISSLGCPDVLATDCKPPAISYVLLPGLVFTFSHIRVAVRRYFTDIDILRSAAVFLGSSLRVRSAGIEIGDLSVRMVSFADSQIPFSVKNSRLVRFAFGGKWFHRCVPISGTVFDLISLVQCDCRIERDLRLLREDSVLVDSLQIEDIASNPIDLRVEEAGEWRPERADVDVQLTPPDKVTISCSPSATLGFVRSTIGLMFGVAFDRVKLHPPDRELGLVQSDLKRRVGECPDLQLLARSPEVILDSGTPISIGWLGRVFDLRNLVAQQLGLPLYRLKVVMNRAHSMTKCL